jgi:hypothetical protein
MREVAPFHRKIGSRTKAGERFLMSGHAGRNHDGGLLQTVFPNSAACRAASSHAETDSVSHE